MIESSLTDVTDSHGDSMMTVKDKREFFEEAQKAEVLSCNLYAKTLLTSQSVLEQIQKI